MGARINIDFDEVRFQIAAGKNLNQIAADMGVNYVTLRGRLNKEGIDYNPWGGVQDKKTEMAEMRERGLTYAQISRMLNVSISVVQYHCRTQGVSPKKGQWSKRAFGHGTSFTYDEDAFLEDMAKKGVSRAAIARILGRAPSSVRARLDILALREEEAA